MATINGTNANDILNGTASNDTINGKNGNDTINGGAGNDTIDGGAGNDTIDGGAGNDAINGGTGNDTIDGGSGNDALYGDDGNDIIHGGLGNDLVWGGAGIDYLYGDAGSDIIYGDDGADFLYGNGDDDLLIGGKGNDTLDGGTGIDSALYLGFSWNYQITYNADGSVKVVDKVGTEGTDTLTNVEYLVFFNTIIAVQPPNPAPVTNNVTASGNEDTTIQVVLSGTDNGSIASFALSSLPANGNLYTDAALTHLAVAGTDYAATNNQLTLYFAPNANFNGSASFNYAAKDNTGLVDSTPASASINVAPVNDAPVAAADFVVTNEDTPIVINVLANDTDVDGDHLFISDIEPNTLGTSGTISITADGKILFTPSADFYGNTGFIYEVSDGHGGVSGQIVTITVNPVNDAPTVANAIPDQSTNEEAAFSYTVPANTFADVDLGDTLSYAVKLANGANLPSWLHFDANTRTLSGTPDDPDLGTLAIKVTATDSAGASASDVFNLTVNPVNDAPTVANAIPDQSTNEEAAFSYTVPANTFADVDLGDTLTYAAKLANGANLPSWLHFDANTLSFSGTPDDPDLGTLAIKVTATDSAGASASDIFNLTVNPVNDAPTVANAIPDQSTNEEAAFSYTVPANTFADVDLGDTLTYAAQLENGANLPSWLHFDANTRTLSGTPDDPDLGTLAIKITATDAAGASASDIFNLTVNNVNDAPTVANAIPDQSTNEEAAFSYTVPPNTFADVDLGDTLTYAVKLANGANLPSWLHFDANTRTLSGTPDDPDLGTLAIKVTATDSAGASASDIFNLTVNNVNDAPTVANAIPDQSTNEDAAFSYTVPADTFADADLGDTLTYAAQLANGANLPSWLHFDANTRTFSGTPDDPDVGTITVKVIATDTQGASVADNFDLTVIQVDDIPNLFTEGNDVVNFNQVVAGTYADGSQYHALAGDDVVTMPINHTNAAIANYNPFETFSAGAGNDTIIIDAFAMKIATDAGNDTVIIKLFPTTGSNILDGGIDTDTLNLSSFNEGVNITYTSNEDTISMGQVSDLVNPNIVKTSFANFENIIGTAYNDNFIDNRLSHNMQMGDGSDTLQVLTLNDPGATYDIYDGGGGLDTLNLSTMNEAANVYYNLSSSSGELKAADLTKHAQLDNFEIIMGTQYNDTFVDNGVRHEMYMGAGNDTLQVLAINGAGTANDIYDGGGGLDTLDLSTLNEAAQVSYNQFGGGNLSAAANPNFFQASLLNFETIIGSQYNDYFIDNAGLHEMRMGEGIDTLQVMSLNSPGVSNAFSDIYDGGGSFDTLDLSLVNEAVKVSYNLVGNDSLSTVANPNALQASLFNFEAIIGSQYNDYFIDNGAAHEMRMGEGNDTLQVLAINGAGTASDIYDGGGSFDTLDLSMLNEAAQVSYNQFGSGDLSAAANPNFVQASIINFEAIIGSQYNDTFVDNGVRHEMYMGAGNDTLQVLAINGAGTANDIYDGGGGLDTLDLSTLNEAAQVSYNQFGGGNLSAAANPNFFQASLLNFETIIGSQYNDYFIDNAGLHEMRMGEGIDTLQVMSLNSPGVSNAFSDIYDGGGSFDTLDLSLVNEAVKVSYNLVGNDSLSTVANPNALQASLFNFEAIIGSQYNDYFIDNGAAHEMRMGEGNDTLQVLAINGAGTASDIYDGGGSFDTLDLSMLNEAAQVSYNQFGSGDLSAAANPNFVQASIINFEAIIGSQYNDTFVDNGARHEMYMGAGNDTLQVLAINGAGTANDIYDGSGGLDTLDLSTLNEAAQVSYNQFGSGNLSAAANPNFFQASLLNFETIIGSQYNDYFIDNAGLHEMRMGEGIDTLQVMSLNSPGVSNAFSDIYDGGGSFDTLDLSMVNEAVKVSYNLVGNDSLSTVANPNALQASLFNFEAIIGSQYNDYFIDNGARHEMRMGNGDDTLQVVAVNGAGLANDIYDGGNNIDTLDLSALNTGASIIYSDGGSNTGSLSAAGGPAEQASLLNFEYIIGTDYSDSIDVGLSVTNVNAGANDDAIYIKTVNQPHVLDGGDGEDRAIFGGDSADYAVRYNEDGSYTVHDLGRNGTDILYNIEFLEFRDTKGEISTFATLFNNAANTVDFNDVVVGTYVDGSQYNALNGDDTVILPNNEEVAIASGYEVGHDFSGGEGNDHIVLGIATGVVYGDAGNDVFISDGQRHAVDGGSGVDLIDYSNLNTDVNANLTLGEIITAAGQGALTSVENVTTGSGNDVLIGSASDNTLIGNAGNDLLQGALGNDFLDGGLGVDTVSYLEAQGGVNVNLATGSATGAAGNDTLVSIENIRGSNFNDALIGDSADNIFYGTNGNDGMNGGLGSDTVDYSAINQAIIVDMTNGSMFTFNLAKIDALTSIENIIGTSFNDSLGGDSGNNSIYGMNGNDTIGGLAGNDHLEGGNGNDTIYGENSNNPALTGNDQIFGNDGDDTLFGNAGGDSLIGGAGNDTLDGGSGTDAAHYSANKVNYNYTHDGSGHLLVIDNTLDGQTIEGTDTVSNVEFLFFNDAIIDVSTLINDQQIHTF